MAIDLFLHKENTLSVHHEHSKRSLAVVLKSGRSPPPFERVDGRWDEQPDSRTMERCGWCIHRFRCAFRMEGSSLIPLHDDRSIAFPCCTRESMVPRSPGKSDGNDCDKPRLISGDGSVSKTSRTKYGQGIVRGGRQNPQECQCQIAKVERYKTGQFGKRQVVCLGVENSRGEEKACGAVRLVNL